MSLPNIFGDIAVNLLAGFADEMAESIKRDASSVHSHPQARTIGKQLAAELFGNDQTLPLKGELLDAEPPTDAEILQRQLAVWNPHIRLTPELLAAYRQYESQRRLS